MKERGSPTQWSFHLFLHLVVQVENRLSPFDSILGAGQVDEQRPLRPRPTAGRIDDRIIVVRSEVLVRRVLIHADV